MRIAEYLDPEGRSPFARWFSRLDSRAASKVTVAVARMEAGNLSNAKAVGSGLLEYRIDWGPGYRIYFARDGDEIVMLVGGGTKQRQQDDIREAIERWADYRRRRGSRPWL